MANAISLSAAHTGGANHARKDGRGKGTSDFEALVGRALQDQSALATTRSGMGQVFPTTEASASVGSSMKAQAGRTAATGMTNRSAANMPASADAALDEAMNREAVPATWKDSLSYIMAQESGGQVGVKNPSSSASGLFQLTAANYHHNPSGAASFGNAVEEAQGGIRYIKDRYGSADNAVQFWQDHHWY